MLNKSYAKYITMVIAALGLIAMSGCTDGSVTCEQFNSLGQIEQQLLELVYGDISGHCESDVTVAGIVIDS